MRKFMGFFTCFALPIFCLQIVFSSRLWSFQIFFCLRRHLETRIMNKSRGKEILKLMENVTSFTKHDWWVLWCLNIFFNLFPSKTSRRCFLLLCKSSFFYTRERQIILSRLQFDWDVKKKTHRFRNEPFIETNRLHKGTPMHPSVCFPTHKLSDCQIWSMNDYFREKLFENTQSFR